MARRLIPEAGDALVEVDGRQVKLTNLDKPFWPDLTKGDLIQYYVDVAEWLLPHLVDRAMVMKRYPHGAAGDFFFMKRAPSPRPDFDRDRRHRARLGQRHRLPDGAGPAVADVVHQPRLHRPQPVVRAQATTSTAPTTCTSISTPARRRSPPCARPRCSSTRRCAGSACRTFVKTSGSKGIHVYVPIERGPVQKQVWTFAKTVSVELAKKYPSLMTAVYVRAKRPPGRVLVDYNQNRWGSTLASILLGAPDAAGDGVDAGDVEGAPRASRSPTSR